MDHLALLSALIVSGKSKMGQSRLARLKHRLLPFSFKIKHLVGQAMGLIDYILHNLVSPALPASNNDEVFTVAKINIFIWKLENFRLLNGD